MVNPKNIFTLCVMVLCLFLVSCSSTTETMEVSAPPTDLPPPPPEGAETMVAQTDNNEQSKIIVENTFDSVPSRSEEFVFTVYDEALIDYASNPMVLGYDDGLLTLAYQSKATELLHKPNEKGKVAYSSDGYTFEVRETGPTTDELRSADGIQLDDGTFIRYFFNQEDSKLYAESSSDGIEYELVQDSVYDFDNDIDEGYFGVRTFFVDDDGGVVMMYSGQNQGENGNGLIYLRQAYSDPEENGLSFTLINEDVAGEVNDLGLGLSYFDPYLIELPDGRFLLLTIFQEHFVNGHSPPLNRDGHIIGFLSDGSKDFEMIGTLFSYSDFSFETVNSLNDPKGVVLEDGSIAIYVAAMLENTEDADRDIKWVLVTARTEPLFE